MCVLCKCVSVHLSLVQTGVVTGSTKWPSMCRKSHFLNGCLLLLVCVCVWWKSSLGYGSPLTRLLSTMSLSLSLSRLHAQFIPIFFSHGHTHTYCKWILSIFQLVKVCWQEVKKIVHSVCIDVYRDKCVEMKCSFITSVSCGSLFSWKWINWT